MSFNKKLWLNSATIWNKITQYLLLLAVCMGVSSCKAPSDYKGYHYPSGKVDAIVIGQTDQMGVVELLGSPTTTALFDQQESGQGGPVWYYIGQKLVTRPILGTEVVEREVVCIEFDTAGLVRDVQRLTLADGENIKFTKNTTPTQGKNISVVQELLANIGRFNKPAETEE